jgi:hypothetical protein
MLIAETTAVIDQTQTLLAQASSSSTVPTTWSTTPVALSKTPSTASGLPGGRCSGSGPRSVERPTRWRTRAVEGDTWLRAIPVPRIAIHSMRALDLSSDPDDGAGRSARRVATCAALRGREARLARRPSERQRR